MLQGSPYYQQALMTPLVKLIQHSVIPITLRGQYTWTTDSKSISAAWQVLDDYGQQYPAVGEKLAKVDHSLAMIAEIVNKTGVPLDSRLTAATGRIQFETSLLETKEIAPWSSLEIEVESGKKDLYFERDRANANNFDEFDRFENAGYSVYRITRKKPYSVGYEEGSLTLVRDEEPGLLGYYLCDESTENGPFGLVRQAEHLNEEEKSMISALEQKVHLWNLANFPVSPEKVTRPTSWEEIYEIVQDGRSYNQWRSMFEDNATITEQDLTESSPNAKSLTDEQLISKKDLDLKRKGNRR